MRDHNRTATFVPGLSECAMPVPRALVSRNHQVIGILTFTGTGNLGDEATMTALHENIQRLRPGTRVCAYSWDPDDTQRRHGIRAFPLWPRPASASTAVRRPSSPRSEAGGWRDKASRALAKVPFARRVLQVIIGLPASISAVAEELRFLPRAVRSLSGVDVLIVSGGGPVFDEIGGAWNFPYSLMKWAILAKLMGKPMLFLSVGAGPIHATLSRVFLGAALGLASYRSFRDEASRDLIRQSTRLRQGHFVYPDLAWSLQTDRPPHNRQTAPLQTVGINPLPFRHLYWADPNEEAYRGYVTKLAEFAVWLMRSGRSVVLFPTQIRADAVVVRDLREAIESLEPGLVEEGRLFTPEIVTLQDLLVLLGGLDAVIAGRFHGILLAASFFKPVLAVSYHQKLDDLMRDMGQNDYLLNIATFETAQLIETFQRLEACRDQIAAVLDRTAEQRRDQLQHQYWQLFGQQ